jgi:hypothetical protein
MLHSVSRRPLACLLQGRSPFTVHRLPPGPRGRLPLSPQCQFMAGEWFRCSDAVVLAKCLRGGAAGSVGEAPGGARSRRGETYLPTYLLDQFLPGGPHLFSSLRSPHSTRQIAPCAAAVKTKQQGSRATGQQGNRAAAASIGCHKVVTEVRKCDQTGAETTRSWRCGRAAADADPDRSRGICGWRRSTPVGR